MHGKWKFENKAQGFFWYFLLPASDIFPQRAFSFPSPLSPLWRGTSLRASQLCLQSLPQLSLLSEFSFPFLSRGFSGKQELSGRTEWIVEPQMSALGISQLDDGSLSEIGHGRYGCSHYRRRCKIIAPCCNEIFDCRHCHNESKNSIEVDPVERHDVPRHDLKRVICSLCGTEQDVQQTCIQCGVCMGKYFCSKCKFFDDDVSKNQYHCNECGICRTGGEENFFHCNKCGCCYSTLLKDSHRCVEKAMHQNCPVCFEFLFDTTKDITVLPCCHSIHLECVKEMEQHFQYSCPVCSKSFCDMSRVWERLDHEVASTPMPEIYQDKMVWILCNDCGETSEVRFHVLAHKCIKCKSYNTRLTQGGPASSCSSNVEEVLQ